MKPLRLSLRERGFTLIEVLVVFAIIAIILVIAAPSFSSMIELQRLRGTNDQLVTDIQFLRTEAASRQEITGVTFRENASMTCYIVHTCGDVAGPDCSCNCTLAEGSRCVAPRREVRTVQLLKSSKIIVKPAVVTGSVTAPQRVMIDPATGSMLAYFPVVIFGPTPAPLTEFWAETTLTSGANAGASVQTRLSTQARPSICSPDGRVKGPAACP